MTVLQMLANNLTTTKPVARLAVNYMHLPLGAGSLIPGLIACWGLNLGIPHLCQDMDYLIIAMGHKIWSSTPGWEELVSIPVRLGVPCLTLQLKQRRGLFATSGWDQDWNGVEKGLDYSGWMTEMACFERETDHLNCMAFLIYTMQFPKV